MKLAANIDRPGLRLALDLQEGPVELAAALADVLARFAPDLESPPATPTRAAAPDAPLSAADRCRRWREKRRAGRSVRHETDTASVSRDTETDTAPCRVDTAERVANVSRVALAPTPAPASRSGSPSDLPGEFLSSGSESESARARAGDTKRNDTTRHGDTAERVASVSALPPIDLDQPSPPWALARVETLRMTLGPAEVDPTREWLAFVAHVAEQREQGKPRAVSEAAWASWLKRSWDFARRDAASGRARPLRPGGRVIQELLPEQADVVDLDNPALDEPRRLAREKREADRAAAEAAKQQPERKWVER